MHINPRRKRQLYGTLLGLSLGALAFMYFSLPVNEHCKMLGPMNTGHEQLACNECHIEAKGTLSQQLSSNIAYLFGQRKSPVTFGLQEVDNNNCLACHDRPNDRHPVHRFEEPRFAEARKNIMPTECSSCHTEHSDVRITQGNTGFCINCHQDTELKNDPLDVPHSQLIAESQWNSCLQCHDFHGNHLFKTAERMRDTIPMTIIRKYFKGGESPYSEQKKYVPRETIYETKNQ